MAWSYSCSYLLAVAHRRGQARHGDTLLTSPDDDNYIRINLSCASWRSLYLWTYLRTCGPLGTTPPSCICRQLLRSLTYGVHVSDGLEVCAVSSQVPMHHWQAALPHLLYEF